MKLLLELLELGEIPAEIKDMKSDIDACCRKLFHVKGGLVRDPKRSKDAKYYGVNHEKSVLKTPEGKALMLTFDNSTDSGEFELNSLAPLEVVKGSELDTKIKDLYDSHEIKSKKKTNYVLSHDGNVYLREVHVGKDVGKNTVRFIADLIKTLRGENTSADSDEAAVEAPKKDKKLKEAFEDVDSGVILDAFKKAGYAKKAVALDNLTHRSPAVEFYKVDSYGGKRLRFSYIVNNVMNPAITPWDFRVQGSGGEIKYADGKGHKTLLRHLKQDKKFPEKDVQKLFRDDYTRND